MNPILVATFIVGLVMGFAPMYSWHSWQNDKRDLEIAEAKLVEEKRNAEIVTRYQDLLTGVSDWYQRNPVRVRVPGTKECPGGITTDAQSVIFSFGRNQGSDGQAIGP